jgi:3',5'-cyclic AMP phosphodiesterase CpdA
MRKLSILVSTLLLGLSLTVNAQSTVRINELATNGATQYNGRDWVELYNPSDEEVSLAGYTLDDAGSEAKSQTAALSGTIPAKGFKVLLEGEDFTYGLGKSEEALTLKKDGTVVDYIAFIPNIESKTLGRISDGEGSNDVIFAGAEIGGWKLYDEADATIGASNNILTFVYTSDQHYGITRSDFRGATDVNATVVNAAQVAQINKLNNTNLPADGGVGSGKKITISHIITTGDISNRAEAGLPKSEVTLAQFDKDYIEGITLKNFRGEAPALFLAPGNHDISNAIGQAKINEANLDATTLAAIYNRMMNPAAPKTAETYDYATDKINYVKTIGGVQFVFLTMWPDTDQRAFIANNTNPALPILIFTHDEPDVEVKHLMGNENLVNENPSGETAEVLGEPRDLGVQRGFANFVAENQNIKAYFHGNTNFNEFYTYVGPDGNISLPTFRIDSPMKGEESGDDETKLSFQIVSIDKATQKMTVREVLWNTTNDETAPIVFGANETVNGLNETHYYIEADYTVPSWTLFKRELKSGKLELEAANVLVSKDAPYNVNTAINGDPSKQFGATWFTNSGVTGTKLQLIEGTSGDFSDAKVFNAASTPFNDVMYVTSGSNNDDLIAKTGFNKGETRSYTSNKVLMNNLKPNTVYSYRVGGINDVWSDVYSFTTAKDNKDPFSFIYVTDTQSNTDEMFEISRKTVATAQANVPDAKFLLMTGDLVETSGNNNSEWEWEQWFETMSASWKNLPIAPAQGNHDTSNKNSNWFNHFNTSRLFNALQTDNNAKTAMEGTTYSFVYGDALFMILTWEDYNKGETYFAAVEQWMKDQIAANSDVKWRIVAFHKNMFTGSKSHQSDTDGRTVRERMAPAFQNMGIDLVFEGHDHVYEVMGVIKAEESDTYPTYTKIEGAVKEGSQTFETPSTATENNPDMTGIHGGIFNVDKGVLYFLNNSAGRKKYQPRTEDEMKAAEGTTRVADYYQFFHRFGQTGEPTFSNVSVSTNAIIISTYTVDDAGTATLFDSFEVIKEEKFGLVISNIASISGEISIYPNPAKEQVMIESKEEIESVNIYSLSGRVVVSQNSGNVVNLSGVIDGTYIIKVKTVSGTIYSDHLFVKK